MDWEEKQARRRERYLELADKAERESQAAYERARAAIAHIPPGQPILVGHYSERGHRADLKRHDAAMRKSIEAANKASYYRQKAESVGRGGISSDDPDAIHKLKAQLEQLQKYQELMKGVNKIARSKKPESQKIQEIRERFGLSEKTIDKLLHPQFSYYSPGYQSFELKNNSANIRRIQKRIEELENSKKREFQVIEVAPGFKAVQNTEENRVQLVFDGKEVYEKLIKNNGINLRKHGFKYSKLNNCWQRHLNNAGIYAAKAVIELVKEKIGA